VDFELASSETSAREQNKNKTRTAGRMRCTVTASYISRDETDKTKVAQNEKGRKWYEERRKMDEPLSTHRTWERRPRF